MDDLFARVFGAQPSPPAVVVLLAAGLAGAGVLAPNAWRTTRGLITMAHEGGHALAAVLVGRRLAGIRLHSNTSGLTVSSGKPTGLGMIFTGLAGYLAPSLLGLAGAGLLTADRITLLLWAAMAMLPLMLIMIRNLFGILSVLATMLVVFGVSLFAPAPVQAAFAYLAVFFLLIGGVRPVFELPAARRRHRPHPQTDADIVARLTGVGPWLWIGLFGVINLAALAFGGWLLLSQFQ